MKKSSLKLRIKAENQIAQCLITGFLGTSLSPESEQFIAQNKIGGVILFGPNIQSSDQVRALNQSIQECASSEPYWVAIDQEGGLVQRAKCDGFTKIPSAAELSAHRSTEEVFELSYRVALELLSHGFSMNLAPVADIMTNPTNPVIGTRAFGSAPETVAKFVKAWIRGHEKAGLASCIKHFPGHGDTHLDSHFALPRVNTSIEVLRTREMIPFIQGVRAHAPMIMMSHVLTTSLDADFPATLSKKTVDFLRKECRFSGVIISDDMVMKALVDNFGAKDAAIQCFLAGCDILEYRPEESARSALVALQEGVRDGIISPERVFESIDKINKMRKKYGQTKSTLQLTSSDD